MKRIRIVGLCLVAAFAMSAVVVASASATPNVPRSGRCLAHAKGKFSDSNCKTLAKEALQEKFEFYPTKGPADNGEEKAGVKIKYKSEAVGTLEKPIVLTGTGEKLHTETKVECKKQTSDGEQLNAFEASAEHIVYTGCESSKVPCSSAGAASGEIKVNDLIITYVLEKFGFNTTTKVQEPAKDKVAEKLVPKTGEEFVRFECGVPPGALKVIVKSIIFKGGVKGEGLMVPAKTNAMVLTSEVKFSGLKGSQKPETVALSINGEGKETKSEEVSLLSAFDKEPFPPEFEESGQTQTNKVVNEEKYELNTVA
jgi:hypothetical protein